MIAMTRPTMSQRNDDSKCTISARLMPLRDLEMAQRVRITR